jgi:hypothetical protein
MQTEEKILVTGTRHRFPVLGHFYTFKSHFRRSLLFRLSEEPLSGM